jgi:Cu2+-exporting ATPase
MGYVSPWLAGLGMALSSLLVVLNALRLAQRAQVPGRAGQVAA